MSRRYLVLAVAAVGLAYIGLGTAFAVWVETPSGPARLVLTKHEIHVCFHDGARSKRRMAVTLVNRGGQPLRILRVPVSCGCLNPVLDRTVLAAGPRAELSFDISRPVAGRDLQTVQVHSTSSTEPVQRIAVVATSDRRPPFVLGAPKSVHLVSTCGEPAAAATLTMATLEMGGSPRWVASAHAHGAPLQCDLRDEVVRIDPADGHVERRYSLTVRQTSGDAGTHMGAVVLRDGEGRELTRLPVSSAVRPIVRAIPPALSLEVVGEAKRIMLVGGSGSDWQVDQVVCGSQALVVEPAASGQGRLFEISAKDVGTAERSEVVEVTFSTTHASGAKIVVPITLPVAN